MDGNLVKLPATTGPVIAGKSQCDPSPGTARRIQYNSSSNIIHPILKRAMQVCSAGMSLNPILVQTQANILNEDTFLLLTPHFCLLILMTMTNQGLAP